jgi:hypothetical protein
MPSCGRRFPTGAVHRGTGVIGYGPYHYKYATGREGDSCIIGLSGRKNYISLFAMGGDGGE